MRRSTCKRFLTLCACLLLLATSTVFAQSNGDYDLSWWTVDGGGATFSNGVNYSLGSTIGQPDTDVLTGGDYILSGGFWAGAMIPPPEYPLYLPMVMR